MTTETFTTVTGTLWTIGTVISDYNGRPYTILKAERDGKTLLTGDYPSCYAKIHPSIKDQVANIVRKQSLEVRGTTEEAEAEREADLESYIAHAAAMSKMMAE
jgi:hypothetical protein